MKSTLSTHIRIIWAITVKDVIDALKNKNVLGVLIPSLFMILCYRYLPVITAEDEPPALLVYDAGNPVTMTLLDESPAVNLYSYETITQMQYYLSNGEQPELGLIIPLGFDQKVVSGKTIVRFSI